MNSPAGERIFVTGGTGFFGRSILSMLRRGRIRGKLTILSRNPEAFRRRHPLLAAAGAEFVAGDVRNFPFPVGKFDSILHAAAPAATATAPGETRSIICDGTCRVLEFARRSKIEKLLFVSSGAVYGPLSSEDGPVAEDHPCRPADEYGRAKLEAERMCLGSGMRVSIARCFAFTGPHLDRNVHFAIGNFIGDALAGRPIVISGDGAPVRSYLYADDLVEWLFALLRNDGSQLICNIGSDRGITIRELAETVSRVLKSEGGVNVLNRRENGGRSYYVPDVNLIRRKFGVSISTDLEEAIRLSAIPPAE